MSEWAGKGTKKPRPPLPAERKQMPKLADPYTLENWQARRRLPEGKRIEQLSLWEKHYYGRVDYPMDAKDYEFYCRWFRFVRQREEAEKKGDAATNPILQWAEYNEAVMWERMAATLLRAHVRMSDPSYPSVLAREDAARASLEEKRAAEEREWGEKIWEKLKDCI